MHKWENDDVKIQNMHREHPETDRDQEPGVSLKVLEQEIEKRDEEPSHHQRSTQGMPRADVPSQEPSGLFRDISIPDQHVLGEPDVTPEDREREQQLTHDVVVLFVHKGQVASFLESEHNDDEQRHAGASRACKNVDAPHGGCPVIIQRRKPIERGKSHQSRKKQKANKRHTAHLDRALRISICILPHRHPPEVKGRKRKEEEVKHCPQPEKGDRYGAKLQDEITKLVPKGRIFTRVFQRCDPAPQIMPEQYGWYEEQENP